MTDVQEKAVDISKETNMIWTIANRLRGAYKADKYRDTIIPMTIIRRFECALAETKSKVVEQFKKNDKTPRQILERLSGYKFYCTSEFTLDELQTDPDNLASNFKAYINGFSPNIQDIINSLKFMPQIDDLDKNGRLLSVIRGFAELDLYPNSVPTIKMGYIFEDLIRRFSENAEAGDHYTGRDIIRLMVDVLFSEGCEDLKENGKIISVLDQACGTGGMLSVTETRIKELNPSAEVHLFGQEINDESYAICLAEMLIKGQEEENIKHVNTFKTDCFPERKMRLVLENPPFGTPWSGKDSEDGSEEAVKAEFAKGLSGRWGAGLPSGGDGQLLFLQSAVNKLDPDCGRAAIIENGSPLFTGGTSSGESQIRRWLLEKDLLEAIIALPTDLFYNTGIATYIWILSKNKSKKRQGKVQLIDASSFYEKLRKSLGNKRVEITPNNRERITKLYQDFSENEYSKIFDNEDFMYREYTVMQPLQRSYMINEERIENMISKGSLNAIYDEAKVYELENSEEELSTKDKKKLEDFYSNKPLYEAILEALNKNKSEKKYLAPTEFLPVLKDVLSPISGINSKHIEKIADGLSLMDKEADIQKDKKGNIIYDKETADTEIVPFKENIESYMKREVLPHIPDAKAFFDENLSAKKPVIKTGAEIPFTRYFYKSLGDTIVCDELVKAIEGVTTNGKTKLQQG
jgi:type I restriction enzyme M protein